MQDDPKHPLVFKTYHFDGQDYPAAWGARAIFPGGQAHVDIVPDRVDTFGTAVDKQRLLDHLNEHMDRKTLDELVGALYLRGSDDTAHTLLDDDVVKVVCSPQGSYGYLYITAVLKE